MDQKLHRRFPGHFNVMDNYSVMVRYYEFEQIVMVVDGLRTAGDDPHSSVDGKKVIISIEDFDRAHLPTMKWCIYEWLGDEESGFREFVARPHVLRQFVVDRYISHPSVIVREVSFETHRPYSVQMLYPFGQFRDKATHSGLTNPMVNWIANLDQREANPSKMKKHPVSTSTIFIGPDWRPTQKRPHNLSDYLILESEVNENGRAPRAYHRNAIGGASTMSVNPFTRKLLYALNMTRLVGNQNPNANESYIYDLPKRRIQNGVDINKMLTHLAD